MHRLDMGIAMHAHPTRCRTMLPRCDSGNMPCQVRAGLEDLFHKYGVDIVFEAHEHSYERLWPTYNNTVTQFDYINPKAAVHLVSGAAGCNEANGACLNPILVRVSAIPRRNGA